MQSNSAVAVAETVQHFITAMDSLKLNMVAVDQVTLMDPTGQWSYALIQLPLKYSSDPLWCHIFLQSLIVYQSDPCLSCAADLPGAQRPRAEHEQGAQPLFLVLRWESPGLCSCLTRCDLRRLHSCQATSLAR